MGLTGGGGYGLCGTDNFSAENLPLEEFDIILSILNFPKPFYAEHFQKFICLSSKPELKAHQVKHTTTSPSFPCILCEKSSSTFTSAFNLCSTGTVESHSARSIKSSWPVRKLPIDLTEGKIQKFRVCKSKVSVVYFSILKTTLK